jgi:MoaA/NifB/PqqE/SkfB family radical SAM enzyme
MEDDNMLSNNKSAKNMYSEDRTRLIDAIPMDVPLCISIEPSNLCNFKCCMCYHGNNEYDDAAKPLKNMDMECFKKVINDIVEWTNKKATKIKLIKLYSLGEPLLHPEICNMVKIIKESDICEKIEITTNGSLLSKNIAKKLVDYGLDIIRFSIYGVSDEINRSVTKSKVTPCEIRQNIEYLKKYRDGEGKKIPIIHTKMLNTYSDENELFFDYYDGIADNIGLDEPFHLELGGAK